MVLPTEMIDIIQTAKAQNDEVMRYQLASLDAALMLFTLRPCRSTYNGVYRRIRTMRRYQRLGYIRQ